MNKIIDTFANRLKYAMTIRNIRAVDLSNKTGISKVNLSYYMSGKYEAKADGLKKLALALDVDPVWLMGYDVPMQEDSLNTKVNKLQKYMEENNLTSLKLLPVYGIIKAGEPNWAEQNIISYIPFDSSIDGFSDKEDYFYLKVDGESMNQIIKNGDYALIRKQNYADNGEIIVALVNGYDATLKRYKQLNEQFILLEPISNDSSIESISVDLKTTSFQILGKFVGYFGKYNFGKYN